MLETIQTIASRGGCEAYFHFDVPSQSLKILQRDIESLKIVTPEGLWDMNSLVPYSRQFVLHDGKFVTLQDHMEHVRRDDIKAFVFDPIALLSHGWLLEDLWTIVADYCLHFQLAEHKLCCGVAPQLYENIQSFRVTPSGAFVFIRGGSFIGDGGKYIDEICLTDDTKDNKLIHTSQSKIILRSDCIHGALIELDVTRKCLYCIRTTNTLTTAPRNYLMMLPLPPHVFIPKTKTL